MRIQAHGMKQQRIWATLHPFFENGPVFGRKEANAGFLDALLRRDPFDAYHFFIKEQSGRDFLASTVQARFPALWEKGRIGIGPVADLPVLMRRHTYACCHLSDWVHDFVSVSLLRNSFSDTLFPITAPVHTLSHAAFGPHLLTHIWGGVSPRDRILATSETTRTVLNGYFEQFRRGYGISSALPQPGLERIPLGVNPELFAAPEDKTLAGKELRKRLQVEDATLFVVFSRLSPLSKMDFFPIFDAFARARDKGLNLETCCLVLAGHLSDPSLAEAFARRAQEYGVRFALLAFPENPEPALRKSLFAAADVFLSPVDNIQETFGLTILEAFAASLPVIASAIDGYRELVCHEQDGLLLPTLGPSSAEASTTVSSLVMPDLYHLFFAQQCAVDLDAFAEALTRLGTDAALRHSMGKAGRAKVLEHYTWDSVVERHLTLWKDLAAQPLSAAQEQAIREARHPLLPEYTRIFRHYFSATADDDHTRQRLVRLSPKGRAVLAGTQKPVLYDLLAPRMATAGIRALLLLAEKPLPFSTLADTTAQPGRAHDLNFTLLWALKHGYLEFEQAR